MKYEAQTAWNRQNCKCISLKLNIRTDADIIQFLEGKQAQTVIKQLIREKLGNEKGNKN